MIENKKITTKKEEETFKDIKCNETTGRQGERERRKDNNNS